MSLPNTTILADSIEPTLMAAIACPPWCTEPARHGVTDAEVLRWREMTRHHFSEVQDLVTDPHYGFGKPVTGFLSWFGCIELKDEDTVHVDPPAVQIDQLPECGLTAAEARQLAARLLELADVLAPSAEAVKTP